MAIYYVNYKIVSRVILDNLLKSVLKRQMPYLIGGTITGTIMAYYYGFFEAVTNVINAIEVINILYQKIDLKNLT